MCKNDNTPNIDFAELVYLK